MLRIGVKTSMWNPWHGCHKFSTGCQHCYVYRTDGKYGKDSSVVAKTEKFNLPVQQKKNKTYKIPSGNLVYTCFTSDFLVEDADEWRPEAWEMMRLRQDLHFLFITKRIDRLKDCLPSDWGEGYDNVTICCTMENQDRIDYRRPIHKQKVTKGGANIINLRGRSSFQSPSYVSIEMIAAAMGGKPFRWPAGTYVSNGKFDHIMMAWETSIAKDGCHLKEVKGTPEDH